MESQIELEGVAEEQQGDLSSLGDKGNELGAKEETQDSFITKIAKEEGGGSSEEIKDKSFVPKSPEEYKLSFKDETIVDHNLLQSFTKIAHSQQWTNKQVEEITGLYEQHMAEQGRKAQEEVLQWEQQQLEAIEGRPNFAEEKYYAGLLLKNYGSPELYSRLDNSRLGQCEELFAFCAEVGKALSESHIVKGETAPKNVSLVDRLWSDSDMP